MRSLPAALKTHEFKKGAKPVKVPSVPAPKAPSGMNPAPSLPPGESAPLHFANMVRMGKK